MSRIEHSRSRYLPLLWPVQQLGAALEHNDVILSLGLLSKQPITNTPISHVSLISVKSLTVRAHLVYILGPYFYSFPPNSMQVPSKQWPPTIRA